VSETDVTGDVPLSGSVHRVVRSTELMDDAGIDATKAPTSSDYIIDEMNRRTIRSDL